MFNTQTQLVSGMNGSGTYYYPVQSPNVYPYSYPINSSSPTYSSVPQIEPPTPASDRPSFNIPPENLDDDSKQPSSQSNISSPREGSASVPPAAATDDPFGDLPSTTNRQFSPNPSPRFSSPSSNTYNPYAALSVTSQQILQQQLLQELSIRMGHFSIIGHFLFAMLCGCFGGVAAKAIVATNKTPVA
jgi:hypothetical protein